MLTSTHIGHVEQVTLQNRNVGTLTVENDYYLQKASYIRLKNVTVDYNLPSNIVKKAGLSNVKVYVTLENLWTYSLFSNIPICLILGVIETGDSDFDSSSNYGLGGVGDGYSLSYAQDIHLWP